MLDETRQVRRYKAHRRNLTFGLSISFVYGPP
jgi:hypothetical protein